MNPQDTSNNVTLAEMGEADAITQKMATYAAEKLGGSVLHWQAAIKRSTGYDPSHQQGSVQIDVYDDGRVITHRLEASWHVRHDPDDMPRYTTGLDFGWDIVHGYLDDCDEWHDARVAWGDGECDDALLARRRAEIISGCHTHEVANEILTVWEGQIDDLIAESEQGAA